MTEVLVAGESLVDLAPDAGGGLMAHPGGSPLNVAVALARLGRSTRLATAYADDEHGRMLAAHLRAAGVEPEVAAVRRTSTATVTLAPDGSARYAFDLELGLPADLSSDGVGWLHVGSLAAVHPPTARQVRALAAQAEAGGVPVSYDPNLRPGLMPPDPAAVEQLVALSTVVKLSEEDAATFDPGLAVDDLADRWLRLGPELVVVTRGAAGAAAVTHAGRVRVAAAAGGPIVDTIGAGDAFTAGLLHALLARTEVEEALHFASRVARRTCERAGARSPSLAELGSVQ